MDNRTIYEQETHLENLEQPSKELIEALKELEYMETHPEDYEVYHNVDKMFDDILNKDNK